MAMIRSINFHWKIIIILTLSLPLYQNCGEFASNGGQLGLSGFGSNTKFQCDPSNLPTVSNTRRLTKTEYVNTLLDLMKVLSTTDQQAFQSYIQNQLGLIPDDTNIDSRFSENSNFVSQQLTNAFLEIGISVGDFIAADSARLSRFVGSCASGGNVDINCLQTFAQGMGKKIYRRPLTPTEVQDLNTQLQDYSDTTAKWLITRMFSSPHFFMHIENTKKDLGGGLHEITDFSLANRISYFLFDTMPDDELFAAAESGKLATAEGVQAELKRLNSGSNQQAMKNLMRSFFDQWLKVDEIVLPDHTANTLMQNYAAGDQLTLESIKNELHGMIDYFTFTQPGRYSDLFTTDISFAADANLAKIYGVPSWSGDPAQLVRFPAGQRAGLLTRAVFLANQGSLTKPIHRGIHIRHDLLCDPLPSPPPEIFQLRDVPFDASLTTRERITNKTADQSCMGCHSKINDTGFALESYDSFGRFRLSEKIFDPETGQLLQEHPVNPHVQPRITNETGSQSFNSPVDFSRAVAESGAAERCFVTTFYEFVYQKAPDLTADGCALETMRASVNDEGGSLKDMLFRIPTSREFRLKRVSE